MRLVACQAQIAGARQPEPLRRADLLDRRAAPSTASLSASAARSGDDACWAGHQPRLDASSRQTGAALVLVIGLVGIDRLLVAADQFVRRHRVVHPASVSLLRRMIAEPLSGRHAPCSRVPLAALLVHRASASRSLLTSLLGTDRPGRRHRVLRRFRRLHRRRDQLASQRPWRSTSPRASIWRRISATTSRPDRTAASLAGARSSCGRRLVSQHKPQNRGEARSSSASSAPDRQLIPCCSSSALTSPAAGGAPARPPRSTRPRLLTVAPSPLLPPPPLSPSPPPPGRSARSQECAGWGKSLRWLRAC